MNEEPYFNSINTVGDLFLEEIFDIFEDENLVFTCVDINKQKYLCVCYEMRQALEWIVCTIDEDTLIKVIKKEHDILYAYRTAEMIIQIKFNKENESSAIVSYDTFDQGLLPDYGVFLKVID